MPSSKLNKKRQHSTQRVHDTVLTFDAIGTSWTITIEQSITSVHLQRLSKAIVQRIEQYDKDYSRFRADSLVSAMSEKPGYYRLPDDAKPLFDLYQKLYVLSEGKFSPLIGRLLSDAGYDAAYSLRTKTLQAVPTWDEALDYQFPLLTIKQPVLLDVGAAGKGYIVDIVASILQQADVSDFCINAGGDILQSQSSCHADRIGLEHPLNSDEVIGTIDLYNQSLCGSAINRRVWGEFTHIIDPHTKTSPRQVLATWVLADTTLIADGLATALFFIAPDLLHQHFSFEYVIVRDDLSVEHSANFSAHFFTEERQKQTT